MRAIELFATASGLRSSGYGMFDSPRLDFGERTTQEISRCDRQDRTIDLQIKLSLDRRGRNSRKIPLRCRPDDINRNFNFSQPKDNQIVEGFLKYGD